MVRQARVGGVLLLWLLPALAGAADNAGPPGRHLGVASCSSAVCHGSVTPNQGYDVLLNEYVTWSHKDAHSRAYNALRLARSQKMAARLGLPDAQRAAVCLDCHSDNVPQAMRGEKFRLADGIGCEACHGGAERWLTSHTSKSASYQSNLSRGMYPTANLVQRTELCLSCHYGTEGKFATHRLMAAGHPRLSFEMGTFLALQPAHYQVDAGYRRRKPTYGGTQVWAYGQLAAALRELETLSGPRVQNSTAFPELALFNCYGCHTSSMHRTDWGHRILDASSEPGSVPVSDGYLCMAWIIARQIDPGAAPGLLKASQALIAASSGGRAEIVARSRELIPVVSRLRNLAVTRKWTRDDDRELLAKVLAVGASGEYRDYIDAEQAVMGIDGLLIELGLANRHRQSLDELYRFVQNDEAYEPEKLAGALEGLQKELARQ
jgi:hypothetical protein